MKCPECGEFMMNIGIPGEDNYVCLEGCDDLTKKMPIIDPRDYE